MVPQTSQQEATTTPNQADAPNDGRISISSKKLSNSPFETDKNLSRKLKDVGESVSLRTDTAQGFKIQDSQLLLDGIQNAAVCSFCKEGKLVLMQHNHKRVGLAEKLSLQCQNCRRETFFSTSCKTGGVGGGAYKVNRQSVMATQTWGRAGLTHLCAIMDLAPPISKKPYNDHLKKIDKEAVAYAEQVMNEAALRLQQLVQRQNPELIHKDINGKSLGDVAVTVDGTWQKRGHSSKIGVVFVISVDTGEVLDYEIKCLVCYECRVHKKTDSNSTEYEEWAKSHEKRCMINHTGSSESMETEGTINIFKRSKERRCLQYTVFVGDGDSSCYGKVKAALEGDYDVQKEECVGHIQKQRPEVERWEICDWQRLINESQNGQNAELLWNGHTQKSPRLETDANRYLGHIPPYDSG